MDNIDLIIAYAEGKITHEEFEAELWIRPELWNDIQKLLPRDIADPACGFRKFYDIRGIETNNYNIESFLTAFDYFGIKTHGLICALVSYNYPDVVCHPPIENTPEDVLDRLRLEYIGGPEVDDLVRSLILNYRSGMSLKKQLKSLFPCSAKRCPDWIQEPEWPMGKNVPMRFISQSSTGDLFVYTFEDVDTGELRIVEQFA